LKGNDVVIGVRGKRAEVEAGKYGNRIEAAGGGPNKLVERDFSDSIIVKINHKRRANHGKSYYHGVVDRVNIF
jgi:hypothetical protein